MVFSTKIKIYGAVIYFLSYLFTGCDGGSSSHGSNDTIPVVHIENGILLPTTSDVRRFAVENGIVYLVSADGKLINIDISNINYPKKMNVIPADPEADIASAKGAIYVLEKNILRVFDADDPNNFQHNRDIELQKIEPSYPLDFLYHYSILCNQGRIFSLLWIIPPRGPPWSYFYALDTSHLERVYSYPLEGNADRIVGAEDDLVYLNRYADISIMNTGDLNNMQSETFSLNTIDPLELAVADQKAYFISQTGADDYPLSLTIANIDTSTDDPANILGALKFTGKKDRGVSVYPKALAIWNQAVYVALLSGELMLFDVNNPMQPVHIKTIDYGIVDPVGVPEIRFRQIEIIDEKAFIGCSTGLVILNLADTSGDDVRMGRFMGGSVAGIAYESPTQRGITNNDGEFFYNIGETVLFSLGGTPLGAAIGKAALTPVDLVPEADDETDPIVTNITRLLLTFDADCDPSNGIFISQAIREEMQGKNVDVSAGGDVFENQVDALLIDLNAQNLFVCGDVSLWPVEFARRHLRTIIRAVPQFKLNVKEGQYCSVIIDPLQEFYDEGQNVSLTLVPETGWKFQYWLGDASTYENPVVVTMNSDRNVVAIPETVVSSSFPVPMVLRITEVGSGNVTANPSGGTYHVDPHAYIRRDLVVALTAKPERGWKFEHWEGDLYGSDNPETIVIDGYKNVTAVFMPLSSSQHTLQADHIGMGGVRTDPPGGIYYKGSNVDLIAIPDKGWMFSGWSGDLSGANAFQTLKMDRDYQVAAEFKELPGERFTLTAHTDRGTVVDFWPPTTVTYEGSTVSAEYEPGAEVTITAVTRPGYVFVQWEGDLSGSDNPQILMIDSDKTITLVSEALTR